MLHVNEAPIKGVNKGVDLTHFFRMYHKSVNEHDHLLLCGVNEWQIMIYCHVQ